MLVSLIRCLKRAERLGHIRDVQFLNIHLSHFHTHHMYCRRVVVSRWKRAERLGHIRDVQVLATFEK